MGITSGDRHGDTSSISLDEAVCISLSANALGKGMNSTILPPPAMSKILGHTGFFSLDIATDLK